VAKANGGDGVLRPRARESEGEPGVSEREQGERRGVVQGIERGGEGRQAGEQVAWRGGARARRPHSPPSVGTKTTEEGGGLGRLLAGPASWLGRTVEEPR
jgi:hypothetical protein